VLSCHKVVTLSLAMARRFEAQVLREILTAQIVQCLLYEAHQKIENAGQENLYASVFDAFLNLGRVKDILGESFEEVRQELYEKAKEKLRLLNFETSEIVFEETVRGGLTGGVLRPLPEEMGLGCIHYGFVAEIFKLSRPGPLVYVQGVGWRVLANSDWQMRPKERGIVGLIYDVMEYKIRIWRKALGGSGGVGGWLEKLEKNINDPDWLSKVEELLLRVDRFGVEIVSDAS